MKGVKRQFRFEMFWVDSMGHKHETRLAAEKAQKKINWDLICNKVYDVLGPEISDPVDAMEISEMIVENKAELRKILK